MKSNQPNQLGGKKTNKIKRKDVVRVQSHHF